MSLQGTDRASTILYLKQTFKAKFSRFCHLAHCQDYLCSNAAFMFQGQTHEKIIFWKQEYVCDEAVHHLAVAL